jgi:hypothetical protein
MDVLVERCAGVDIGKADLKACVRTPGARGRRSSEVRIFATTTRGVLALREQALGTASPSSPPVDLYFSTQSSDTRSCAMTDTPAADPGRPAGQGTGNDIAAVKAPIAGFGLQSLRTSP